MPCSCMYFVSRCRATEAFHLNKKYKSGTKATSATSPKMASIATSPQAIGPHRTFRENEMQESAPTAAVGCATTHFVAPERPQGALGERLSRQRLQFGAGGVGLPLAALGAALDGGPDESGKQRLCGRWFRFEFRMKLHGEKPRMIGQLDDLDELAVRARAGKGKAVGDELLPIHVVELVAVAMPLCYSLFTVGFTGPRSIRQRRGLGTQPHGAAFVGDVLLLVQKADHRVRRVLVELG